MFTWYCHTNSQNYCIIMSFWVYFAIFIVVVYVLRRLLKRKVIDLQGKKVLITGAASGSGRMLANDMVKKVSVQGES